MATRGEGRAVTEFWFGAALLLGLAALFLFFPGLFLRRTGVDDSAASNRDWFERRSAELVAERDPTLLLDAKLRLLEDVGGDDAPRSPRAAGGGNPAPWLLPPLALLSALLYWWLGAAPDVRLTTALENFGPEDGARDYRELMLLVERRAGQRPDNVHYQAMLGRFYMNEADYGRAGRIYLELSRRAPGDASAPALAAQAAYFAADRVLDGESQMLAERALSIDPHQRTALGLLGMHAYEQEQYAAAIDYWRRLLATEEPDSPSARTIEGVIARARESLDGASQRPEAFAAAGTGITVRLELPDGAELSGTETVFLFARDPAAESRMPVAVRRLSAAQLPATVRLDDAASMAGRKLSELAEVKVLAQVSPSGRAGAGDIVFQGELPVLAPSTGREVHRLRLQPAGG